MVLSPIELRHELHRHPELSFQEFQTTKLLIDNIRGLKSSAIKIHTPLPTGLLAEYRVNDGDFLLFRADIDALPVKEETGVAFQSSNGNMHACGHDIHAAVLYGFIQSIVARKLNRNMLFLFQPGEETGGGAKKIIDSGILKQFNITGAFSLHVTDAYPPASIASVPGVLFASAMEFNVEFIGRSAHVAMPQNGKNALTALRMFLDAAEKIPHPQGQPAIFGVGKVRAGDTRNIIPAHANIEGTLRMLSSASNLEFFARLKEVLEDVKKTTGVDYRLERGSFYPEVTNHPEMFEKARKALAQNYKIINCGYKMTGEDFGFFAKEYPSFMFWLGAAEGRCADLHTPFFFPEDTVIQDGIDIFNELLAGFVA